jgi:hypothetical protein
VVAKIFQVLEIQNDFVGYDFVKFTNVGKYPVDPVILSKTLPTIGI